MLKEVIEENVVGKHSQPQTCPNCNGSGKTQTTGDGKDGKDGKSAKQTTKCATCSGKGTV